MKKRIQSLDEFINESLNEKVLNEGEKLEPGTKVLFIPFSARKNVLTPGEIVEKHKKGNDWYVIRNNKGDIEEVLRVGIKAIPGKTFEIVIYEGKIDEFKMSLDNYKKMVRKLVNKETFEDELFYENMISSFTEGKSPVECVKIWKKTIREDVNEAADVKDLKKLIKNPKPGYYYEHENGEIIFKPFIVVDMGGGPREYFDSSFVKRWWKLEK